MKHSRARKTALRSGVGLACVALVLLVVFFLPKTEKVTVANSPQWSEKFGAGEVFPACGTSALPTPIVCAPNVGQTCYLTNSCGQKSAAGVIGCDGTCGNKYETTKLTPSGHYLGTFDDFRNGPADVCSQLVGQSAGGAYACAPNLNTQGPSCASYSGDSGTCATYTTNYYAESRHNGGWGTYALGQNWCPDTGVEWVQCGPAIFAPPDSNCPATSSATPGTSPAAPGTSSVPPGTTPGTPAPTAGNPSPGTPTAAWSPAAVSYPSGGTIDTISFSSTGAQSCNIYDSASGALLLVDGPSDSWPSGTFGSPWNTMSWGRELVCYSAVGAASSPSYFTATVQSSQPTVQQQVPAASPLSASCSGTPGSAFVGQPVTWSSSVSGGSGSYTYVWSGTDGLFDTVATTKKSYATPGTKQASLTVTDAGSGQTTSATCNNVDVGACTASVTPADNTIDAGGTTSVTWSVSGGSACASSCTGSGFNTGGAISGTANNVAVPNPPVFSIACTGGTYGPPTPANQSITVITPAAAITANGQTGTTRVNPNTPSNTVIEWSSGGNVTSCSGTNFSTGGAKSGSVTKTTTSQTTYTVTCTNKNGASATASVTVNILAAFNQF